MKHIIGIDLGTTNSATAIYDASLGKARILPNSDESHITPSVIQFRPDGVTVFGDIAKEAYERGESGCASAFKRFMGTDTVCCIANGREYRAWELSALLLGHLKAEAEAALGEQVTDVIITVPAYFGNAEKQDTMKAATAAGLNVLRLIHEPTAAALTYAGRQWRENAMILVVDVGGGTSDVTLVGMEKGYQLKSLATNGDHQLGGKDWDERLVEHIRDRVREETGIEVIPHCPLDNRLHSMAERCKKTLCGPRAAMSITLPVEDYGSLELQLTRAEFDQVTCAELDKIRTLCEVVLRDAGVHPNLVTDVLLVGGSTRMPQIRAMLTSLFGKAPIAHVDPDEAVAMGAAIQSSIEKEAKYVVITPGTNGTFNGADPKFVISGPVKPATPLLNVNVLTQTDVQAHGLGVVAVNSLGNAYHNELIIPANAPIPACSARALKLLTRSGDNNEMEIFVVEGDKDDLHDCALTDKYVVSGIRHVSGGAKIRVQYSFDTSGITHVQARQGAENVDLPIRQERVTDEDRVRFLQGILQTNTGPAIQVSIMMAVDVSGSMDGTPLRNAKKAMHAFVNDYEGTGVKLGVMVVSDRSRVLLRPTDDCKAVRKAIDNIEEHMTGVCNAADPFTDIHNVMKAEKGERYAIVLADGVWQYQEKAIERAKKCHREDIQVCGLGFGCADEKFIRAISSTDELSIMTSDSSQLVKSFGKIAQSIGTPGGHASGKTSGQVDEGVTPCWDIL